MFDGALELQLDCIKSKSSTAAEVKHEDLLSLPHPAKFPSPFQNGPSLAEMSSPLSMEPRDIKLDPAAGDMPANTGASVSFRDDVYDEIKPVCLVRACRLLSVCSVKFALRDLSCPLV